MLTYINIQMYKWLMIWLQFPESVTSLTFHSLTPNDHHPHRSSGDLNDDDVVHTRFTDSDDNRHSNNEH